MYDDRRIKDGMARVFMKRNIGLRVKILFMCLGCTLVALLLQTLLFELSSSGIIYDQAKDESYHNMENMQNEIYAFISRMEYNMVKIYNDSGLMRDLRKGTDAESLREKYYRFARDFGGTEFETSQKLMAMYLYTPEHELISVYRKADTPRHKYPLDIYEGEGYNGAAVRAFVESEEKKLFISGYYNENRRQEMIRFVLKLYKNSNFEETIGYLVCDVDSRVLTRIMQKYSADKNTIMWLQASGDMPVAKIGEFQQEDEGYYRQITSDLAAAGAADRPDSASYKREFFQVEQKKYNLTAYALMPRYVLEANQRVLRDNLILIAALMTAAAVTATYVISRSMTRPLDSMMDTIEKIKAGDTRLRVDLRSRDEIGRLGQSFNEMLDEMEILIEKEYKSQILLNRAQYKALQAQINPHFLYNTLDTMGSIAELRNCPEVSRLCQSLSGIFRYSLDMKDPLSTVAKEIAHLKNYIFVMSTRMQDHVNYEFSVEEGILQESLPRISIQPLVENALNHGLRNKRGEKRIVIEGKGQDGLLYISVTDNGVGMDGEALGRLNQSLEENSLDYVEKGDSIGLHNINARLKMLYGNSSGVRIDSRAGEGTRVTLRFPQRSGEGGSHEKADV